MIPGDFVRLESFPRTSSGKVDRKALPRPDARTLTDLPVAPRDAVELELTHIWKDLLGKESVGVCDDFFLVGGHSLLAVRLLARIRDAFGQDVPLAAFYQNPTIEQIAAAARANDEIEVRVAAHRIKPATGAPPLFLTHAAGGRSINYYGLARAASTPTIRSTGSKTSPGVDLSVVERAASGVRRSAACNRTAHTISPDGRRARRSRSRCRGSSVRPERTSGWSACSTASRRIRRS
jgi:hypothetical protein